jgi:hypothetical protein
MKATQDKMESNQTKMEANKEEMKKDTKISKKLKAKMNMHQEKRRPQFTP